VRIALTEQPASPPADATKPSRPRVWEHGRVPDRLKPALGLAVVAFALALSGCGGAGKSNVTTSASAQESQASKARFIAQAEVICGKLKAQETVLRAHQEALKGLATQSADTAFVALVNQLVADSRSAEGKLRALPRPAKNAGAIEGLLNALSEEGAYATGIAKAASNQESALGETAEKDLKASVVRNSAVAARYGMKDCIGSE
jgi:hypothetical protein